MLCLAVLLSWVTARYTDTILLASRLIDAYDADRHFTPTPRFASDPYVTSLQCHAHASMQPHYDRADTYACCICPLLVQLQSLSLRDGTRLRRVWRSRSSHLAVRTGASHHTLFRMQLFSVDGRAGHDWHMHIHMPGGWRGREAFNGMDGSMQQLVCVLVPICAFLPLPCVSSVRSITVVC